MRENQKKNTENEVELNDESRDFRKETEAVKNPLRLPLFVALICMIPLLDQFTKWIIVSRMSLHDSIPVIDGVLSITHIHNSGIAFGFFPGLPKLFLLITILSMLVVVYFYLTVRPRTLLVTLGCALILGGAAGNLLDRVHYGYVVDFINFSFWPAFNVADSSVSSGVVLLLLNFFLEKKEVEHASNFV